MLNQSKVAILGTGTMGRALGKGMLTAGVLDPSRVRGTVKHERELTQVREQVSFEVSTDNDEVAAAADIILLCTKPRDAAQLLESLYKNGSLAHKPLLISIAAGISTSVLEAAAGGGLRVVRAMPNTPCLVGAGMIVITPGSTASEQDLDCAEEIFGSLGRVLRLDEEHMDAVTGLSGSGPAFLYVIIEALSEGGVMTGLPRKVATEMAAQTALGAAKMVLETGRHPAALKDEVTTPAGCTISALLSLEDGRLRSVLARGVQEAARAASGLGSATADSSSGRSGA